MSITHATSRDTWLFVADDADGRPISIDVAQLTDAGEFVGAYGGRTLAKIRAEYPDAVVIPSGLFAEWQDAAYRAPVSETDEREFFDMLGALPPVNWLRDEDGCGESFKMSEHTCGNITNIYARLGERYFRLCDSCLMPHDEIMRRVGLFIEEA